MTFSAPQEHHHLAHIHPQAKIHPTAEIGPFAVIHEGVTIGAGTRVGAHVVLYPGVHIGENCRILPGTCISADASQLEYWRNENQDANHIATVRIGDNVHIEPSANIHGGIVIDEGSWIGSNSTIHDGARIGKYCKIFPGAVISAIPQDLKFKGEKTLLEIGDYTVVREFATLNRGTDYHGKTQIGHHCLIMAYVHVAHDCIIGDHVIMVNGVNLAGHVQIDDWAILEGLVAVQQFTRIGRHSFVAGGSLVRKHVPPYVKAAREPLTYTGINSIGLRRRNFQPDQINAIQEIYRQIFLSGMNTSHALDYVEQHLPATEERDEIVGFIRSASRGIIKGRTRDATSSPEIE
ncbi:MAG: acyl-ACP--UDP-N-acetylglucosamine O-acyltransferase [Bacteroidetes bacterium]|nr:MAG: acyl-ACP--UDP-N-acetylglucosamine O-acyltransferase [Bacteroidota bacterium]